MPFPLISSSYVLAVLHLPSGLCISAVLLSRCNKRLLLYVSSLSLLSLQQLYQIQQVTMPAGQELTQPMFIQSTSQTADGQVSTQVSADWCASLPPWRPGTDCAVTTLFQTSSIRGIPTIPLSIPTHSTILLLYATPTRLTALTTLSLRTLMQLFLLLDCSF